MTRYSVDDVPDPAHANAHGSLLTNDTNGASLFLIPGLLSS